MSTLFRTGPAVENFSKTLVGLRPSRYVAVAEKHQHSHPHAPSALTSESLRIDAKYPLLATASAKRLICGLWQLRCAHTDVSFPDMDEYRRGSNRDPFEPALATEDGRRVLTYISYGVGGIIGLFATKAIGQKVVAVKWASKADEALATIEVDTAEIPPGKVVTVMWRGKPVFVHHRTQEDIARENSVPLDSLRDPATDESRSPSGRQWVVTIGICTHLGCVPMANAGDFGGFYCPCHGSHYDSGGRIRKGPAPLNLEIPEHGFRDNNTLLIGGEK
jgi:ubiquinol-cytochrome c reductase iron-sulfur subunit